MSVSLSPMPRTDQTGVRADIETLIDQTVFLALFVSVVGLLLTKGPTALMTIAGFLGSYLRLAALLFQ